MTLLIPQVRIAESDSNLLNQGPNLSFREFPTNKEKDQANCKRDDGKIVSDYSSKVDGQENGQSCQHCKQQAQERPD